MSPLRSLLKRGRQAAFRSTRMRRLMLAGLSLAVVAIILLTVSRVLAVDLLGGDGGFDSSAQWANWGKTNVSRVTFSQDTATFAAGPASAKLSGSLSSSQSGAIAGYLSHPVQVSKAAGSLQLTLSYRKDIGGAPTSSRIYWELWDAGSTRLASGDIDTAAGTSAWTGPLTFGLAGLNLQPGATYTLRLGFSSSYNSGMSTRTATVWFDSVSLVHDIEPPTAAIVAPSPAAGSFQKQSALTFDWQGSDNVTPAAQLEFQYSTDGGSVWSAWTAGQTQATATYAEGANQSFAVRARDQMGNVGNADQRSFAVDLTPPTASIASGLADGGASGSASQTFSWSGQDNQSASAALTYEYSVDGGATWTPAGSTTQASVTYAEGASRTFDVRATDQTGNTGPAVRRTFTIDLTPPTVQLNGGPDGGVHVNQATQSFSWLGADQPDPLAVLEYQYSSDGGGAWSVWDTAAAATTSFPEGPATFSVRGRDPAGNVGQMVTASFVVDLTPPPVTNVTATPNITEATLTFTTQGDPATGKVRYGTAPGQPQASAVEAGPVENHQLTLTGLQPNTTYYYTVEAVDLAGNQTVLSEASFGTLPDNQPPDTQITGGPADGSWQRDTTLTFSFSGTDNVTAAASLRFSYSTDGGQTWSALAPATSVQVSGYGEGLNQTFQARAVDEAGNYDPTPAQRTFSVDRTAPVLSLASGPDNGAFVTTTTPLFTWSATDALTDAANLVYATSVDGGQAWSAWSSAGSAQPTYAEGKDRSFAVKARDLAGNESPVILRTFNVDVTAPTAAITGGLADGAVTNVSRQTFTWSGGDNVSAPAALLFSYSLDAGKTWSAWTLSTQVQLDLPDGGITLQVQSRDEAGHVSAPAVRHFTVDTRPPVISGLTLVPQASHADLSWRTTGDPSTSTVRWGTSPGVYTGSVSDTQPRENHTAVMSGLQPGVAYYYVVEAADVAGNTTVTAESSFTTPAPIPHVIATVPDGGDPNAGTGTQVKAYFDVDMDPATLTVATFRLVETASGAAVQVSAITYDAASRAAILVPTANLSPNTGYTATVTTLAASLDGQHLPADYAWSFTTGATVFASPHGSFTTNNAACKSCHNTHSSPAAALLSKADVTSLCFTCHDGTGSSLDVKGQFTGGAGGSLHPVKNLSVVSKSLLDCSDCHNAHGDTQPNGSLYPRLLRVSQASGGFAFGGNQVCLACHGPADRQWSATYWADTAGDHTNASAAHYQNFSALIPPSGTGITCISCHKSHASPSLSLLQQPEPEACLSCHENPANAQSGRNIRSEFSGTAVVSRHDVFNTTGASLACSSCHGPHTVAQGRLANGDAHTEVSNPQNTKQDMAAATSGATAAQRYTDFCLACHSGNPPVKLTTPTALVPITIVYPGRTVTTNAGGGGTDAAGRAWNKATYTLSAHYQAGLGCTDCHSSHGSSYDNLVSRPEDTSTSGAAGICGKCHSGNPPAQFASAPNVWPDLTRTGSPSPDRYRHPTLYIAGQHSDTEDYSVLQSQGKRHAECLDCHDPHNEQSGAAAPPSPPGPLRNVSGAAVSYGAVTWSQWNPAGGTPAFQPVNPISNQYELCFKCHTYYSFQNSPPQPAGGITETDVAREFNPNNPSYHAVVGTSTFATKTFQDSKGVTHYYGKFAAPVAGDPATRDSQGNPWSATSRLYCEDCHRSGADNIRGPHGSNYWYILRAPWTRATGAEGIGGTGGTGTQDHLCFKCHDYNFYASGSDSGSDTVRSQFAGPSGQYNLHAKHDNRGCTSCHVTVAHGWKLRSLLADKGANGDPAAPAPYYDSSYLIIRTWRSAGNWREMDCDHSHS